MSNKEAAKSNKKELAIKSPPALLAEALTETAAETILSPIIPLKICYDTYKKYKDKIKEGILIQLMNIMAEDIRIIKKKLDIAWLNTTEGEQFCFKVTSIATNGEHIEKMEYFAHALVNLARKQEDVPGDIKFKFIDILKNLSKLDLKVLAEIKKWAEPDAIRKGYKQVEVGYVLPHLGDEYSMEAVEASFINLVNNGVLSKVPYWDKTNTPRGDKYQSGPKLGDYDSAYYNRFTMKFVKFITPPAANE